MSIAFRAQTGQANSSTTTITLTVPATAQSGDVAYVVLEENGGNTWTAPSGWTLLHHSSTTFPQSNIYRRVLTSGDPGTPYSWTQPSADSCMAVMLVFSGVNNTTPEDVTGGFTDGAAASTSIVCPSITTVTNGCMLLIFGVSGSDVTFTNPGGSWTTGQSENKVGTYYETQSTAGATGTTTITQSSSAAYNSGTIAMRPASGGGTVGPPPLVVGQAMKRASFY
jgi:hypothetical protein